MDTKDIREHFGEPIYSKTLPEAIAEGHLASIDYTIMSDEAVRNAVRNGFEPKSLQELAKVFELDARNEEIVDEIRFKQDEIKEAEDIPKVKTIVFGNSISHVEELAAMLNASPYHSEMPKARLDKILNNFRNGAIETIVVNNLFNEGVDVPDARLVVFLRSTQSTTIFEQQLGRGLRKIHGKSKVSVLDFVANIERVEHIKLMEDAIGFHRFGAGVDVRDDSKRVKRDDDPDEQSSFEFSEEIIDLLERYHRLQEDGEHKSVVLNMSREDIIDAVNRELGSDHASKEDIVTLNQLNVIPGLGPIYRMFESIDGLNTARGLESKRPFNKFDNDQIVELADYLSPGVHMDINMIQAFSEQDMFISGTKVMEMFGSLYALSKARGIEVKEQSAFNALSNEDIVMLANDIFGAKRVRNKDIVKAYGEGQFISPNALLQRFGSIDTFNRLRGVEGADRSMPDEEIVTVANALFGDTLVSNSMINESSKAGLFVNVDIIRNRFGSVALFNQARGLKVDLDRINFQTWTNEEIVNHTNGMFGNTLLTSGLISQASREGKLPSGPTLKRRFGSVEAFNKARGITEVQRRIQFSQMDNDAIARLANSLMPGKEMITSEIMELSRQGLFPSSGNIRKRFGSIAALNQARGL